MEYKWHNMVVDEIMKIYDTSMNGLSAPMIIKRIEQYGKNILPKKKRDSLFKIFIRQMMDPIVLLLFITVIFSLLIHEVVDAIAILFIIVVDLIMGTFQEWKAEKNAEGLSCLIHNRVLVIRSGKEQVMDSSELVPGDIVLLESGNRVSADLRIIESSNLQIDESVLTGESVAVVKEACIVMESTPLAERRNMVYAGTSVSSGRAKCIVVETASNTEIGKIAFSVIQTKEEKSPLTIRMEKFSKQISLLVVIIAILIAFLLFYKNVPGSQIFLSVIALSVSAMPEGLPLALTMALTIASNRMAKKNVIVKKLNAVESLGSCTVIASDKTGTLTINEQTAKNIVLPSDHVFAVEGIGYNDRGEIIPTSPEYENLCLLGVLNNEATLDMEDGDWKYLGDSIDVAFLSLGRKAHVSSDEISIIKRIPYESENKYSAVFYQKKDRLHFTVKGSIEKVLEFCSYMRQGEQIVPIDTVHLLRQNEDYASRGYRMIALADGVVESINDISPSSLVFEGMVAFMDPVREEVKNSILECKRAGIRVVMITGDHPLTAYSIALELNLAREYNEVTTGIEVEEYFAKGEQQFLQFVSSKSVFTRVTPMQKLQIVDAYKRMGEFVAVTGDGVNDSPALKTANIGIAMGSGTDVAKDTASMIVVDDNFTSIVAGVKEGRNAYSNIRKVSYMLLSCGLAEVLFFLLSIFFDLDMPLVAIQLLWLNIVTDGLQDFALSFERAEMDIMDIPPRSTKESIFNKELFIEVLLSGVGIGLLVFAVWAYLLHSGMEVSQARGYVMVLMVFIQNIHVFNCRSERHSTFSISIFSNPLILFSIVSSIVLQIIVMEVPILSTFLQTTVVPWMDMLILLCISFSILFVMEIYKILVYRKKSCH